MNNEKKEKLNYVSSLQNLMGGSGSFESVLQGLSATAVYAGLTTFSGVGTASGLIALTMISTVIGIPAGKVVSTIVKGGGRKWYMEQIYGEDTIGILYKKLNEQFNNSMLTEKLDNISEINESIDLLVKLGIAPYISLPNDGWNFSFVDIDKTLEEIIERESDKLGEIGQIRISVPAIHPSAVASFKYMSYLLKKYGKKDTNLIIDCSSVLGIEMLMAMGDTKDFDFLFITNSPLFLWQKGTLLEKYWPILPVARDKHRVLAKRSRDKVQGPVWLKYQPGTSAQEQVNYGEVIKNEYRLTPLKEGTTQIKDYAINLSSNEGIIAISPFCDKLALDKNNEFIDIGDEYYTRSSLYAHKSWVGKSLSSHTRAFALPAMEQLC